jgi:hypothetical protein
MTNIKNLIRFVFIAGCISYLSVQLPACRVHPVDKGNGVIPTDPDIKADAGSDIDTDADADGDADAGSEDSLPIDTSATFDVEKSISKAIPTVGIVTWSVNKSPVHKASIEFGPTEEYGISAPSDVNDPSFRTLLLGMKTLSVYHFRIRAVSDEAVYVSGDYTIETGPLSTGLPVAEIDTRNQSALADGYTVGSFYQSAEGGGGIGTPYIVDKDGDFVWWYHATTDDIVTRAKMSADGKYMMLGTLNVGNRGLGAIVKISMDGLSEETISIPDRHHDFTVLPNGSLAYFEFESSGSGTCDRIGELNEFGEKRIVYTVRDDFAQLALDGGEWCHSNAIHYVPSEDAYYLSVLDQNMILKINRTSGRLEWALGGADSDFADASWSRQHGHHTLDNGNILLFNNNRGGGFGGGSSLALEFALDEGNGTATEVWQYDGGASSMTFGDVQRLDNGNTLVTYSNDGLVHEVDPGGRLLQSTSWGSSRSIGYLDWRKSLYDPPNRW